MKVAINTCYGGFSLSDLAIEKLLSLKGIDFEKKKNKSGVVNYYQKGFLDSADHYIARYELYEDRSDLDLISVIEELGEAASGQYAQLKIAEAPDFQQFNLFLIEYQIENYDGMEHIRPRGRDGAD